MTTPLRTPRCGAALLVLALLATPCLAVTSANPNAARATLLQGVIEQGGSALRINGKNYALSPATTVIYDRSGARVGAAQLVAGKTVAFSIAKEGSQTRIKELWLID